MPSNETQSGSGVPGYVEVLRSVYGPPSDGGFGSAVFYTPSVDPESLEVTARDTYRSFVGRGWTPEREAIWLAQWNLLHRRAAGQDRNVIAELRALDGPTARSSVDVLLDGVEDPQAAQSALAGAMDDAAVSDFEIWAIGDGELMSGLLLVARRANGETTLLVSLMD